jgi:type II secretory pathway component PulK
MKLTITRPKEARLDHPVAKNRRRESGIALIIVLIVIVVLGMLAAAFAAAMKVETTLARHTTFNSDLDWAGRAGVEVARWVLGVETQESRGIDSLKLKSMGGPGDTNSILYGVDLKNYQIVGPLGETVATLSFDIQDMDRKFNINTADKPISWTRP